VGGLTYNIRDIRPGLDLDLIALQNNDTQLGEIKANKFNPNAQVSATYFGAAVNGVLGRMDLSAGVNYANGTDGNNLLTGTAQQINAGMGFIKADYPINYWKPHAIFLVATGDANAKGTTASGWDSVNDGTNLFGGQFSFFEGNNVVGTFNGANIFLSRGNSVVPSLRNGNQSSNFVNPGLVAMGVGLDVQLHPKVALTTNLNSFSFQQNPQSVFGAINAKLPNIIGSGTHFLNEANFGLFIRPGLADDFEINTGLSFDWFDQGMANALFGGQTYVESAIIRFTLTY